MPIKINLGASSPPTPSVVDRTSAHEALVLWQRHLRADLAAPPTRLAIPIRDNF